jgi:hypothetical protein
VRCCSEARSGRSELRLVSSRERRLARPASLPVAPPAARASARERRRGWSSGSSATSTTTALGHRGDRCSVNWTRRGRLPVALRGVAGSTEAWPAGAGMAGCGASRERQRETSAVGGEDKRETGQLEWLARMGEGDKRMRPAWSVETERRARENIFFRFFSY